MPGSNKKKVPTNQMMPDMSSVLENVLSAMPGMEKLPPEEKKKMKKAIKATTEKVQSMDLEGIFKDAMGTEGPPPPPSKSEIVERKDATSASKTSSSSKPKKEKKKKKVPKTRTPDKQYQINLSLEELFLGKTSKKLTVRVERRAELTDEDRKLYLEHSGEEAPENSYKYESTKIKQIISERLEPGMMDDDEIVFVGQADEAENSITGDIVASIVQDQHPLFERENNDLWILNKKVSLAESYFGGFKFAHLDGRLIEIAPKVGEPLHSDGGLRRIPNAGMPIREPDDDEDGVVEDETTGPKETVISYGDLYIQFELDLPESFAPEQEEALRAIFPDSKNDTSPLTAELIESGAEIHKKYIEKVDDPYDNEETMEDDDSSDDSDDDESDSEEDSDEDSDEEDSDDTDESEESEEDDESVEDFEEAQRLADEAVMELLMEESKKKGGKGMSAEEAKSEMEKIKAGTKSI